MHILDTTSEGLTVQLTHHERSILNNALNEVCNGIEVPEFATRMGAELEEVEVLLRHIHSSFPVDKHLTRNQIPDFHDATLLSVQLHWGGASIGIQIKAAAGLFELRLSSFSNAAIPQRNEWGASSRINCCKQIENTLSIEMQSGDILLFEGFSVLTCQQYVFVE